jgi:hypothetical protein
MISDKIDKTRIFSDKNMEGLIKYSDKYDCWLAAEYRKVWRS